jgi:hypothetical protein
MALLLLALAAGIILLSEMKSRGTKRVSGSVPVDKPEQPWSKIVQKGQTIIGEPFTSIGGYAIACDGRDFMYAPEVDLKPSKYQIENPQELPLGV